jgi:hypothetical protein
LLAAVVEAAVVAAARRHFLIRMMTETLPPPLSAAVVAVAEAAIPTHLAEPRRLAGAGLLERAAPYLQLESVEVGVRKHLAR